MEAKDVYIVIPHYGDPATTEDCLRSLVDCGIDLSRVIIVNNSPQAWDVSPLKEKHTKIHWIDGEIDFSFARANNQAAAKAKELGGTAVLLLNNDTIVTPDFLAKLIKVSNEKNCGAVIPSILIHNSNLVWAQGSYLSGGTANHTHINGGQPFDKEDKEIRKVPGLTGCCFLCSIEIYEKLGGLDTSYFLYSEDVDFWVKLGKAGYDIFLEPTSIIYHKVSQATGGAESPLALYYHFRNRVRMNKDRLLDKHYSAANLLVLLGLSRKSLTWINKKQSHLMRSAWLGVLDGYRNVTGKVTILSDGRRQL